MFKKAERRRAKIKIGISGPSGSGKTMGALLIAKGLGGKVAVIDSENGSASLYADNKNIGLEFDVAEIHPPYTVDKYTAALRAAVQNGYGVVIIDSVSHAWAGDGGILNQKTQVDARGGNSFTNWAKFTPMQESFISSILSSDAHVICTMRSKQDYVMSDNGHGKQAPKKVGLAPVQRDGFEYELGIVFDVDMNHVAVVSKDRTSLFGDVGHKLSEDTGKKIKDWLESGSAEVPQTQTTDSTGLVIQTKQTETAMAHPAKEQERPKRALGIEMPILDNERQRLSRARTKAEWIADDVKRVLSSYDVLDPIKMKPSDYRTLCSRIESGMTPDECIRERQKEIGAPTDIDLQEALE